MLTTRRSLAFVLFAAYQTYLLPMVSAAEGQQCACPLLERPDYSDKELSARWLVHTMDWGIISTQSTRLPSTPFGNVVSFVDGGCDDPSGVPYFYGSHMDQTFIDMVEDNSASLTLSEASLPTVCGASALGACTPSPSGDPENPMCARLTITGKLVEIEYGSDEYNRIQSVMFQRHPSMETWPGDHEWMIVKLVIEDVWFIDFYGGPSIISPDEFLGANAQGLSFAAQQQQSSLLESGTTSANDDDDGSLGGGFAFFLGFLCAAVIGFIMRRRQSNRNDESYFTGVGQEEDLNFQMSSSADV